MLQKIKELRKILHQNPELSGFEKLTAEKIVNFVRTYNDTQVITDIGGHGIAVVYKFSDSGPTIGIRCELDALPITEENEFEYRSINEGVSHKCGHDGHMAIVAGLIFWIKEKAFTSGQIVLLFQPAEETGKGAFKMLNDIKFQNLNLDYLFALHNIPGEPMHSIIQLENNFSAEVQSVAIYLKGKKAHAAQPENGINPTLAVSTIVSKLSKLNEHQPINDDFAILTPIHILVGQKSYGISPENAELHYTLRTWDESVMKKIKESLLTIVKNECEIHKLKYTIDWFEHFPATQNNQVCNHIIQKAARINNFKIKKESQPFRFGEDFGWFSKEYKAAMFGIGSGVNSPALHHADYDFPEEIIDTGISMFKTCIESILKSEI